MTTIPTGWGSPWGSPWGGYQSGVVERRGLANLALDDARAALARCPTMRLLLRASSLAECLARIHLVDAGGAEAEPYLLLTCQPLPSDPVATDLRRYAYRIEAELWMDQPADPASDDADLALAYDLDQVVTEMWAQHDGRSMDFELSACGSAQAVRDDDTGANAGDIANILVLELEAWDA